MKNKTRPAPVDAMTVFAADHTKIVEWSEEDGCFIGSAPPIIGPACHGADKNQVYQELCVIVEEWLALMEQEPVS